MIGLRVDANNEIATGHVMRCLSIALGFRRAGLKCIFISADEKPKELISSFGFEMICLNSKWNNLVFETKQLLKVICQYDIDRLIIDSYYVTYEYLNSIQTQTKVIYIDDMNFFKYPVSMVINYNLYYGLFDYEEIYQDSETQLLLGCSFAPLRDEFIGLTLAFRDEVKKVLISTGGTDQYNVAGNLVKRIIKDDFFKGIEFHIIVGSLNQNSECLKELSNSDPFIFLHKNIKDMAKLMMSCDMAITAGGSTMYELCACGIPSITFAFTDNQLYGVKSFEKEGIMAYAGDVRDDEDNCLGSLIRLLKEYTNDVQIRKEKSRKMREKVDGNGVKRIVKAIIVI